jgi:ribulose-bisphosphate carboxylase small chain
MFALISAPTSVARSTSVAPASTNMKVWTPFNNKFFETLSYLPPLSEREIAMQIEYLVRNGMTPCIEFAPEGQAVVSSESCTRMGSVATCYYDNRYWTMWKLPMFGCTDAGQVLNEIRQCKQCFPNEYIRVVGYDADKQVQSAGFLVTRPGRPLAPEERSVGGMGSMGRQSSSW